MTPTERRILISPVTRIEGHAKISIYVDDAGEVESAQFHVVEFRGFEKICQGRPFHEMPGLMSRICGICPISHILTASKACDEILGVEVPVAAEKQRRLMNFAQILQSHALSFFHLSAPDLLLGMDSDPAKRNVFGLAEVDPGLVRRGIRVRQFGQRIIELVGGKKIHPSWGTPGGVMKALDTQARDEISIRIPEVLESVRLALAKYKSVTEGLKDEIDNIGNFPSLYLGTVTRNGELEFYDGVIRISDGEGNVVADGLDPRRFESYLGEASEESSYMKFPYYKPMGYPGGMYRVGPLARLHIAKWAGTSLADRELREFKQKTRESRGNSFHYHWARLIEMLHCVERIEELMADPDLMSTRVRARAGQNRNVGVGSCEAPRGTLFHRYNVDDNGLVQSANLLIATSQNNLAINKTVEQAAKRYVRPSAVAEGMLNRVEAGVRCYDPCLSCSTHALGQMPMVVEIRNRRGEVVREIRSDRDR